MDSIRDLVQSAGISPYQHYIPELDRIGKKVLCKLHGDKNTPNLSLTDKGGKITFSCFACGKHGDALDFIQGVEGIGKTEAIEKLKTISGNGSRPTQKRADSKPLTLEQIKGLIPDAGYRYIRHHAYKAGNPPYIKALYRNEAGDKIGRFFTFSGDNQYQWNRQSKAVLYNQAAVQAKPSHVVFYPEGEKDCDSLSKLGLLSVTAGGANDFSAHLAEHFLGRDVVLLPDNDSHGRECMQKIAGLLQGIAASIRICDLPGLPVKGDISDWIQAGGTKEGLLELVKAVPEWKRDTRTETASQISIVSIHDFLAMEIPQREVVLSPWLPSQGLCMVYGYRGSGKTYILLGVAVAISSGGAFLRWHADNPRRVVYIDGEMPAKVMQERLSSVIASADKEPLPGHLQIITSDFQKNGLPDLSTPEGQSIMDAYFEKGDVVILDNISTLCRTGKENTGDDWGPVQAWGLSLRRKGISVIFVHHEGKNGLQRGTSKREDVLDTVIRLKRPGDYSPHEGLRVEVHYEKNRGIYGEDVKPFEVKLTADEEHLDWQIKDLEESLTERVAGLLNEGVPQNELAEMLQVSKGTVSKHKKRAQDQGLLKGVRS